LFISSNPHSFSFSNWFVYPTWVSHGHISLDFQITWFCWWSPDTLL
jgi:hypothetical protein